MDRVLVTFPFLRERRLGDLREAGPFISYTIGSFRSMWRRACSTP